MDSDLSAEIARIEAELAQDAELRQQQQQQQVASPPQQPQQQQLLQQPFSFGGENPFGSKPLQQAPSQQQQQQQQQSANPFNINASPFVPQQPQQQQQQHDYYQQQPFMGGSPAPQGNAAVSGAGAGAAPNTHSFSKDTDSRSIFVGNLPKGTDGGATTTPEELVQFFSDCGSILNCTVLKDRATGELKGTAYVEFADYTAMGKAIDTKNNANFKGSTIIVTHKRSNFKPGRGGGRGGRGGRGRGGANSLQAIAAFMGMLGAVSGYRGGRGGGGGGRGAGRGGRGGSGGGSSNGGSSMSPGVLPPGGFQPYQ